MLPDEKALAADFFEAAQVEHVLAIRRGIRIILGSFDQFRLNGILIDVTLATPKFFSISHPAIVESCMPYRKALWLFNPDPMSRPTFDHLHGLFNCCCVPRRQQDMQMIRHQNKSMQLVKSSIPTTHNLFDDNICQGRVNKEWMFIPSISRHKIGACLVNPPGDPSHLRTLRG